MTRFKTPRRAVLLGGGALAVTALLPLRGRAAAPQMHVVKDPDCGCCTAWIEILEKNGIELSVQHARGAALQQYKVQSGVPVAMRSCHTAHIEGYVIEGHVPLADIRRLLEARPEARGLAVPGMPVGSPGMGPEAGRDAYDVHLLAADGTTRVFASYPAG